MAYTDREARLRYARKHYVRYRREYLDKARLHDKRQRAKCGEYLRGLKDVPCVDCGMRYPHYVMQFDHVPEKGRKSSESSHRQMQRW